MTESILRDAWDRQRDDVFDTDVHIYTHSGRGYHNVVLTNLNKQGVTFYESDNEFSRVVMNMDSIEVVELVFNGGD